MPLGTSQHHPDVAFNLSDSWFYSLQSINLSVCLYVNVCGATVIGYTAVVVTQSSSLHGIGICLCILIDVCDYVFWQMLTNKHVQNTDHAGLIARQRRRVKWVQRILLVANLHLSTREHQLKPVLSGSTKKSGWVQSVILRKSEFYSPTTFFLFLIVSQRAF